MTKKRLTQKTPVDRFHCKAVTPEQIIRVFCDVGKLCYVVTTHMYTSTGVPNFGLLGYVTRHAAILVNCVCMCVCVYIYKVKQSLYRPGVAQRVPGS